MAFINWEESMFYPVRNPGREALTGLRGQEEGLQNRVIPSSQGIGRAQDLQAGTRARTHTHPTPRLNMTVCFGQLSSDLRSSSVEKMGKC